eukprot:3941002-Rhodomonas_salina.4
MGETADTDSTPPSKNGETAGNGRKWQETAGNGRKVRGSRDEDVKRYLDNVLVDTAKGRLGDGRARGLESLEASYGSSVPDIA